MFDVIIVGGGPSGLSAALVLGRCLRRVVVLDAGHPRNAPARVFNGYLSRDGSSPAEFLEISREQLARYDTVTIRKAEVVAVDRQENAFTVTTSVGESFTGRMLLLATGVTDELPQIEGLRELYGKSVHTCPYCDGWEFRGTPMGVLGSDDQAAELAIELQVWSRDVVIFSNGPDAISSWLRSRALRCGISINQHLIDRLEGNDGNLQRIWFKDGGSVARSCIFFMPEQRQRSDLAQSLGCRLDEADAMKCANDGATNVPGVYAVGNATRGVQLVIAAVAEGTLAAKAINERLLDADMPPADGCSAAL